jgi:glycosyltransferase involved in cell wall biosynthesis
MSPKLSIITVNYNNREGLQKTILSVLQQTSNCYEYLIIDGDSSDGSKEIIEDNKDRLSYWISEPDSGVYEAMNKGIRKAQGEYLLFLNSGDFFVNEKVLEIVFSIPHESDLLIGQCHVSLNGKVIYTVIPPPKLTFGFLYHQGIPHQSTFIKRELFDRLVITRKNFGITLI